MTIPPVPPIPPRKPMSEAELDALSQITPSDIARARAAWEETSPVPFRKLLDATADDESAGPPTAE